MKKKWRPIYEQSVAWYNRGELHQSTHNESWSRMSTILHPLGVVEITEWHNISPRETVDSTEFRTVIDGYRYTMVIYEVHILERSLKIHATKFLTEANQISKMPSK